MPNTPVLMVALKPYRFLSNIVERLAAASGLILLSPLILGSILLVKSDGGPAFFFQDRVGRHARIFRVIKLRTMVVNAESMQDERGRPTGARITRFGHFLRKTSIDELPQLVNVLKGDMGLVGPRPILPRMLPYLTSAERVRFAVRPGVTGLAQIKGRNQLKWSRRFHYDVIYVHRKSLRLDVSILLRTVRLVFAGVGVAAEANPDLVDDITIRPLFE
ncbi:MAG: sugar transferase [Sulfitobacter geojensis]